MSSAPRPRVVITGIGQISPLGSSAESLWSALCEGRSGVRPWQSLPAESLPTPVAGEATQFQAEIADFGPLDKDRQKQVRKGLKVMNREIQMGIAAAFLALADAKIAPGDVDPERTGVICGSDYMMTLPDEFSSAVHRCAGDGKLDFPRWGTDGLSQMQPLWLLKYLPNMPASHIAIFNDFRGPNNSITQREASANLAIGEAFAIIQRGHADVLVSGSTGTRVHPLRTLHVLLQEEIVTDGVADPGALSRPFDRKRSGMVLGEGSAALILERLDRAVARGATIYGEMVGQGSSAVADKNLIAHRRTALGNAARAALRDAGMKPEQVGHVHAHGLSTRTCDVDEALAIRDVLGTAADRIPVTAAKSYFGNLGAASGMVELIASLLAMQNERLFPILNLTELDPDCPITPAVAGSPPGDSVLNLSVTPQGQAAAVVVKRFVA